MNKELEITMEYEGSQDASDRLLRIFEFLLIDGEGNGHEAEPNSNLPS